MSQGPRGGWVRGLFAGLGAVLCVGVIGCTDIDKPKTGLATKQPGPGLPGTARLPGQPGSGAGSVGQSGMNTGMQPMGSTVGRSATSYPASGSATFGSGANGNSVIPSVGPSTNYATAGGSSMPAGAGMGAVSSTGAAGAGFSTPPSLSDPPLYPPAAPDSRGGPVMPPGGSGPIAPTNYR